MVAQLREPQAQTSLPLLMEPSRPTAGASRWHGWWTTRPEDDPEGLVFERCHGDDVHGALVQHTIARYLLTDITRAELAREVGMASRALQSWLNATSWRAYGEPVLERLAALGIGGHRGSWTGHAVLTDSSLRPVEIVLAASRLMAEAADALAGAPISVEDRDQLIADLRLLSAARETM